MLSLESMRELKKEGRKMDQLFLRGSSSGRQDIFSQEYILLTKIALIYFTHVLINYKIFPENENITMSAFDTNDIRENCLPDYYYDVNMDYDAYLRMYLHQIGWNICEINLYDFYDADIVIPEKNLLDGIEKEYGKEFFLKTKDYFTNIYRDTVEENFYEIGNLLLLHHKELSKFYNMLAYYPKEIQEFFKELEDSMKFLYPRQFVGYDATFFVTSQGVYSLWNTGEAVEISDMVSSLEISFESMLSFFLIIQLMGYARDVYPEVEQHNKEIMKYA